MLHKTLRGNARWGVFQNCTNVRKYRSNPNSNILEIKTSLFYGIDPWRHH